MPDPERWEIPGVVPCVRVLLRSDDVAVLLGPFEVHSNGIEFLVRVQFKPGFDYDGHGFDGLLYSILRPRGTQDFRDAEENLQMRARLSAVVAPGHHADEDLAPTLSFIAGSGSHHGWRLFYFAWPVPDHRSLTIEGIWPELGMDPAEIVLTWQELQSAIDARTALA